MSSPVKITDMLKSNSFSYSFEVTPDVLYDDIDNLNVEPVFFSVTWHAKYHKCEDLDIGPIRIAKYLRSIQKSVLMHMSCDMMRKEYLNQLLKVFQDNNICNLFVILGVTGDYFCIGVAGFPDHKGDKLLNLKQKMDSGANFILTQAFFEKVVFKNFVESCKEIGITAPIIPGVFLYENLKQLNGFINFCRVKVSNDLLEQVRNSEDSNFPGRGIVKKLLKDVTAETGVSHFHFFTLNKLDFVSDFVKEF
ncbi:hypothetical protein MSG28_004658 [Choristoneura fumiferana]|uniref:Uncharacterized protein n=1 Tax=Choristoneura fumiferana TaxID=7141 RepID=A0ACC0K6T9_CHOFU|nr:hypothetical protein MSG28_004658 [Choristoneura fumiferana]